MFLKKNKKQKKNINNKKQDKTAPTGFALTV